MSAFPKIEPLPEKDLSGLPNGTTNYETVDEEEVRFEEL